MKYFRHLAVVALLFSALFGVYADSVEDYVIRECGLDRFAMYNDEIINPENIKDLSARIDFELYDSLAGAGMEKYGGSASVNMREDGIVVDIVSDFPESGKSKALFCFDPEEEKITLNGVDVSSAISVEDVFGKGGCTEILDGFKRLYSGIVCEIACSADNVSVIQNGSDEGYLDLYVDLTFDSGSEAFDFAVSGAAEIYIDSEQMCLFLDNVCFYVKDVDGYSAFSFSGKAGVAIDGYSEYLPLSALFSVQSETNLSSNSFNLDLNGSFSTDEIRINSISMQSVVSSSEQLVLDV